MIAALALLGAALVVFGAVVLLLFPDRPGGKIGFRGLNVSSTGAGLPLIVLGVALVVTAVALPKPNLISRGGPVTGDPVTANPTTGDAAPPNVPGPDSAPASDCTTKFFAESPPVPTMRIRPLELGARTRLVLGPGETQSSEFGLVLVDVLGSAEPQVLGAITVIRRPGVGFSVLRAVDDKTCQPVGLSVKKAPGVPAPAALGNHVNLLLRLGGDPYLLTLSSDGQVVVGELHLRR